MTADRHVADDQPVADDDGSVELTELRLRVAAQDRLIEAMLEENESIHEIRRNMSELARLYDRLRRSRVVAALLVLRARLRQRLQRR